MRITLNPEDCKFFVNKEKRKIVCVYENCRDNLSDIMWHMPIGNYSLLTEKALKLPDKFSGIATCAEEDEWNEEFGKQIAFFRLREKYYKSIFKHANAFVHEIDKALYRTIDEFNAVGEKLERVQTHDREWVKKNIG